MFACLLFFFTLIHATIYCAEPFENMPLENMPRAALVASCRNSHKVLLRMELGMREVNKLLEQVEAENKQRQAENNELREALCELIKAHRALSERQREDSLQATILRRQRDELRSFDGWLFHKKGIQAWVAAVSIVAMHKKGAFNWVVKYEKKLKNYLRKKVKLRVMKRKKQLQERLLLFFKNTVFCKEL